MTTTIRRKTAATALVAFLAGLSPALAEDWPEWRGAGRRGVWNETGLLDTFPSDGLKTTWRTPVKAGYAGPAVAGGRVFVTDFERADKNQGTERALALDEATGEVLWKHSWDVDYAGLEPRYAIGPRATPTVDGGRVYVLGAMGALYAFSAKTGEVAWQKDAVRDYKTKVPVWGMTGAPLVDGERLVALVGGAGDALVVAFDKATGRELWRALSPGDDPGYAPPVLFDVGGRRQLVVWHPRGVAGLDPETGEQLWEVPFEVAMGLTVATPVLAGRNLVVSSFFNGSMMLELSENPGAKLLWRGKSSSEVDTDGLHALITTPVIDGGVLYGICSYGELRALDVRTGERLWESLGPTVEKARWAAAFFVRAGDRYFINNDRGELILARLTPDGYEEIDRTELIEPTSPGHRRERKYVHWSHPAYANRHVVVRNDREIVRANLGAN